MIKKMDLSFLANLSRVRLNLFIALSLIVFASCSNGTSPKPASVSHYVVVNNGEPGDKSTDLLLRMNEVYKNKPGLVIVMIGTNDINKLSLKDYTVNLDSIVRLLKGHNEQVLLLSPPPHGTAPIVYPNVKNEKIDAEVKAMDSIAVKHGCFYLDMNAAFKAAGTPNATASSLIRNQANFPSNPDGVHPTSDGYLFIAQQVYAFMNQTELVKYKKISCFGDSITHGPYPSLLAQLLNGGGS